MQEGTYQWDSADYARHSSAQQAWAHELIAKLGLQGHETLLDIGCGNGSNTADLAALLPLGRVVGIDSSADMVRTATASFPREGHPNLEFRQMDARDLAFDEEFDVAFSSATLHWVTDHRPVLAGVQRALRPGGRLLFQMGGRGNAADILSIIDTLGTLEPWRGHFQDFAFPYGFYGPEDYESWLAEAGLRPRRTELIPKDMQQKGRAGLAGWIRTTWLPCTSRLPEELRERFIMAVVDAYLEMWPMDDHGAVHVRMVRLEVEAEKPRGGAPGRSE